MKVKEYLVNRILKLEEELKQARNEKAGVSHCLELQKNKIDELNEKLEQYQIEREHIKQIITCNLTNDGDLYMPRLNCSDFDIGVLLSILDIKPEDYKKPDRDEDISDCPRCKHEAKSFTEEPCASCLNCNNFEPKEVIPDAEDKD